MLTAKLCKACEAGDVREVEELLMSGATPNFAPSGNCYRYPLHCAASSGHAEIVKLLLQHEATVDPLEASSGWTPLMIATLKSAKSQKHIDVMMVLLEGGADAEVIDARGNTILHILASRGQTELLKQLLQKIPSLDILGPGFGYMTPLHYATEAGHVDTVEFLLQLKADPRGVDASGWTPVHWACRRGHKQVVDLLLSYGGSIEDRDFFYTDTNWHASVRPDESFCDAEVSNAIRCRVLIQPHRLGKAAGRFTMAVFIAAAARTFEGLGEKPMEPKPHSVCSPAHPDNEGRAIENKETRTQCQQDARCEYLVPPVQRSLYYTSATYCGELVTVERRSAVPGKSSSTRRGSSGGRVDSSSSHEYAQGSDSISVVSGESKEKLWLSNLEEGSATSPRASGQSQVILMALENNTANPWLPGILEFVYGSEVHESEAVSEIHASAPNFDRVFLKEATIPRWNDNVGWGTDREAYRLPCVTPCSSMQQKIKQENPAVGLTVPPESPLVVSHEGPVSPQNFEDRGLRPEKFISRLRSYPKAALPLARLHAKASCKAFQLLFTGAHSERRLASAETVGDQKGHMQRNPEVLCTFRDLKKRGQWPLKPHTNYAEYDVMVAQRERHIFNWFERVVASRYAAVTVVSKSEPTKVNEMTSETGSCSSECGLGDDLPRESRQSPSVDQMGAGIKWATFSTLFPQSDNTAQVDGLKGALPTPTLEGEKRVPCLRTEDLFDFPVEEPVTSDGRQYPCCKGHFLKRGFEPSRNKMGKLCLGFSGSLHSSKVGGPAIPGGGRSIRGESGSDQIDSPILHYRFKDMVELPHLREVRKVFRR
ncbi:Ankyrin-3, related [Eimeria maxima]|uniref:Ankyrin-3, related n=1 Tax=Eimeria maxima TaxID=5804 RepID=U6M4S2_EIMMA|nr:Ankyrin-3, related [Eimeria maxima]CDJ58048.1 Ankyrin-3, related [Eimeria maxima]